MRRYWALFACFLPGVLLMIGALAWGWWITPPTYAVPAWADRWFEPKYPLGRFRSWRVVGDAVEGQTEPFPFKHPRASSFLRSRGWYSGDVRVDLTVRFRAGAELSTYLGCYLCYDPVRGTGYWLATGHDQGEFPHQAYVKLLDDHQWRTEARGPLRLSPGEVYRLSFRRTGDQLSLYVDDRLVVSWEDGRFDGGQVQIQLHRAQVKILALSVSGTPGEPPQAGGVDQ